MDKIIIFIKIFFTILIETIFKFLAGQETQPA